MEESVLNAKGLVTGSINKKKRKESNPANTYTDLSTRSWVSVELQLRAD